MESLTEEIWDVVIVGTSLPQSLLALSLSRSGKKVLHLDANSYYGGNDAGLSLSDVQEWVDQISKDSDAVLHSARIASQTRPADSTTRLGPPRSYTLSLNPQIIYAQSSFLPTLVSSQIHNQLEFLAVGSWWVHRQGSLHKIPSSREDVFNDEGLSIRDKRSLMKFLRYVLQDEGEVTDQQQVTQTSLGAALEEHFKVPPSLQSPLLALALSQSPADSTDFETALRAIRKHMRSIGYFGPGFGAVVAKYGGNAEIAQVACRAQAVGGGVYILGHGVTNVVDPSMNHEPSGKISNGLHEHDDLLHVTLSDGTVVRSRYLARGASTLTISNSPADLTQTLQSTIIVASPLRNLFPATAEHGPVPAVAIVLVDDEAGPDLPPIYLQVHSEDTGECPSNQCVIYGSVRYTDESSAERLKQAVQHFLATASSEVDNNEQEDDKVLWQMSYISQSNTNSSQTLSTSTGGTRQIFTFPNRPYTIAQDDKILDDVKVVWENILGTEEVSNQTFLRFEDREQQTEEQVDA